MSLSLYNQQKEKIEILKNTIFQKIEAAEEINDISDKRRWSELLEALKNWNTSISDMPFPVSDELYQELGFAPIQFEMTDSPETRDPESGNVSATADLNSSNTLESSVEGVLVEIETKVTGATDKYTLDMAHRLLEAANLKIANENLGNEFATHAKRLDALLNEKKTLLAHQKIEDARKAVNNKDYASARALFKEAQELCGPKSELYSEAQKEIDDLPTEVERGDIDLNLYQVEHSPDIHEIEISLRILETYIRSGRLTKDDLRRITSARERFNRVRAEQGIGLSIMRIGDLQNKYLLYLRAVEGKLGYEDNDVNVTNAMGAYQQQSAFVTKDELEKTRILAAESPLAARNKVRALLDEKVTVEIAYMVSTKGLATQTSSSKDGTQEEAPILNQTYDEETGIVREVRLIHAFPIQQKERNEFEDFLQTIKKDLDSEEQALALRIEGENSGDEYTKLDRYIQARGIFKLRGLDEKIKETLSPASIARREMLKNKFLELNSRLQNLVHLQQSEIKEALEKIEEAQSWLVAHMNDWRANGIELILPTGRYKCSLPEELNIFINEELRPGLDAFQREFIPAKTAFLRLCSLADGIRNDLNDALPAKRTAAINTFHQLEVTERVKDSAIYRELDALVTGNADFNSVYQDILAEKDKKEWALLIGHIEQLKNRPDYANCSVTIQEGVEAVRAEAEPEFYLENLTTAIQNEDFTGALEALDWLDKNGVTRPNLAEKAASLEMLRTSGASMQEFYRQTLAAANLGDLHPLVGALFQRKKLAAMVLNKLLPEESVAILRQICGEGYFGFSESAYLRALKEHLKTIATLDLERLLARLDYVSGREKNNKESDWPNYTDCIAKNNALVLARYLRQALHDKVIDCVKGNNTKELRILIEVSFAVHVVFSESDLQMLVSADYNLAQNELMVAQTNDDLRYKKWQILHNRWPTDQRISTEWKKSLIQHYQKEINSLREMAKYSEAYNKVEDALNDEEIGAQDQFFIEKVGICLELKQLDEAKSILDEIGKRISSPEFRKLATRVSIEGILTNNEGAPSEVIRNLIELSHDPRYDATEIDQYIKDTFQKYSQIFRNEIETLRDGDKIQALIQVLRFSQMESEYQSYIPGYVEQANKYVVELSPSLVETGRELSIEFGELLGRCDAPDSNDSLASTITAVKDALAKGRPFINLFTRFLPQLRNRSGLQTLVEELINALEQDAGKRQNLIQLLKSAAPIGTTNISFISLQGDVNQLGNKLGKLENEKALLFSLCQNSKWENVVQNVFSNQVNSWAELETEARRLSTMPEFSEIRQFSITLGAWKTRLAKIYTDCLKLSDDYINEKYEEAGEDIVDIRKQVEDLPAYFGSSVPQSLRTKILDSLSASDLRSGNYFGLERIKTQIGNLLQELTDWEIFNQHQENLLGTIEEFVKDLLLQHEVFWRGLQNDEKKSFEGGYYIHMRNLNSLSVANNFVLPTQPQPHHGGGDPLVTQEHQTSKNFIFDIFGKNQRPESPLMQKLRRPLHNPSWENSTFDSQAIILRQLIVSAQQFFTDNAGKPMVNSSRAEILAEKNKKTFNRITDIKASAETILADIDQYEKLNPYPSKEELEHQSISKQYIKMAQKMIAADYLGPRDGYINATYRPTAISGISRGS